MLKYTKGANAQNMLTCDSYFEERKRKITPAYGRPLNICQPCELFHFLSASSHSKTCYLLLKSTKGADDEKMLTYEANFEDEKPSQIAIDP